MKSEQWKVNIKILMFQWYIYTFRNNIKVVKSVAMNMGSDAMYKSIDLLSTFICVSVSCAWVERTDHFIGAFAHI